MKAYRIKVAALCLVLTAINQSTYAQSSDEVYEPLDVMVREFQPIFPNSTLYPLHKLDINIGGQVDANHVFYIKKTKRFLRSSKRTLESYSTIRTPAQQKVKASVFSNSVEAVCDENRGCFNLNIVDSGANLKFDGFVSYGPNKDDIYKPLQLGMHIDTAQQPLATVRCEGQRSGSCANGNFDVSLRVDTVAREVALLGQLGYTASVGSCEMNEEFFSDLRLDADLLSGDLFVDPITLEYGSCKKDLSKAFIAHMEDYYVGNRNPAREAIIERALELDPFNLSGRQLLVDFLIANFRFTEAQEKLDKAEDTAKERYETECLRGNRETSTGSNAPLDIDKLYNCNNITYQYSRIFDSATSLKKEDEVSSSASGISTILELEQSRFDMLTNEFNQQEHYLIDGLLEQEITSSAAGYAKSATLLGNTTHLDTGLALIRKASNFLPQIIEGESMAVSDRAASLVTIDFPRYEIVPGEPTEVEVPPTEDGQEPKKKKEYRKAIQVSPVFVSPMVKKIEDVGMEIERLEARVQFLGRDSNNNRLYFKPTDEVPSTLSAKTAEANCDELLEKPARFVRDNQGTSRNELLIQTKASIASPSGLNRFDGEECHAISLLDNPSYVSNDAELGEEEELHLHALAKVLDYTRLADKNEYVKVGIAWLKKTSDSDAPKDPLESVSSKGLEVLDSLPFSDKDVAIGKVKIDDMLSATQIYKYLVDTSSPECDFPDCGDRLIDGNNLAFVVTPKPTYNSKFATKVSTKNIVFRPEDSEIQKKLASTLRSSVYSKTLTHFGDLHKENATELEVASIELEQYQNDEEPQEGWNLIWQTFKAKVTPTTRTIRVMSQSDPSNYTSSYILCEQRKGNEGRERACKTKQDENKRWKLEEGDKYKKEVTTWTKSISAGQFCSLGLPKDEIGTTPIVNVFHVPSSNRLKTYVQVRAERSRTYNRLFEVSSEAPHKECLWVQKVDLNAVKPVDENLDYFIVDVSEEDGKLTTNVWSQPAEPTRTGSDEEIKQEIKRYVRGDKVLWRIGLDAEQKTRTPIYSGNFGHGLSVTRPFFQTFAKDKNPALHFEGQVRKVDKRLWIPSAGIRTAKLTSNYLKSDGFFYKERGEWADDDIVAAQRDTYISSDGKLVVYPVIRKSDVHNLEIRAFDRETKAAFEYELNAHGFNGCLSEKIDSQGPFCQLHLAGEQRSQFYISRKADENSKAVYRKFWKVTENQKERWKSVKAEEDEVASTQDTDSKYDAGELARRANWQWTRLSSLPVNQSKKCTDADKTENINVLRLPKSLVLSLDTHKKADLSLNGQPVALSSLLEFPPPARGHLLDKRIPSSLRGRFSIQHRVITDNGANAPSIEDHCTRN